MNRQKTIENRIISLIFSAGRNFRKENDMKCETIMQKHLSLIQLETLKFIDEEKNPLMKDVSDYLFIAPPSLTPIIDVLEKRKLIKRSLAENDRRATILFLTGKGKQFLDRAIRQKIKETKNIFSKLTEKEQETLVGLLEKISGPKQ